MVKAHLANGGHDQRQLEDVLVNAKGLGITAPELEQARARLQEHAKDAVGKALENDPQDDHLHVRVLSHAIRQSQDHGHSGAEVLQAQKLRTEKLTKYLTTLETNEDLIHSHNLLEHAREHAGTDLGPTVITSATDRLRTTAEKLLTDHKMTGAASLKKLEGAIHVCKLENCGSEELIAEAHTTLRYEKQRHTIRTQLQTCKQAGDLHCLVGQLRDASELGLPDLEVSEFRTHAMSQAREQIQEAKSAGGAPVRVLSSNLSSNASTGGGGGGDGKLNSKQMRDRLVFGEELGLPEAETKPLRDILHTMDKARMDKAIAQSIDMGAGGLAALLELEAAGQHLEFLSEAEKQQGRAALTSKVKTLMLTASTLPSPQAAELTAFAARDTLDLDAEDVKKELVAVQKRLATDMQQADPDLDDCAKLNALVRSTRDLKVKLQMVEWKSAQEPDFLQVLDEATRRQEKWHVARASLRRLEDALAQEDVNNLRGWLDVAQREGQIGDVKLAPIAAGLKALEAKQAAHKAKGAEL